MEDFRIECRDFRREDFRVSRFRDRSYSLWDRGDDVVISFMLWA